jgi:hypothetical protein
MTFSGNPEEGGRIYTACNRITALTTAAAEVVTLLPSSMSRVELVSLHLGQPSSGAITPMLVELFRGSTGGSTGATVTPVNRNGWSAAPASTCAVTGNSTTPNSTASASLLHLGTFDQGSGKFDWEPCHRPNLEISQRFSARVTPMTTAILTGLTMTLTFREGGKIPGQ